MGKEVRGPQTEYNPQKISQEISILLEEGCVLTTEDIGKIASKYGYSPKTVKTPTHFAGYQDNKIFYGDVEVIEERIHRARIIRNANLPLEQTEYHEIVEKIRSVQKARRSKIK